MFRSDELKQRIIQEQVPGRQITLSHIIANPDEALLAKVRLDRGHMAVSSAIGVLTVTPAETALILADIAIKASGVVLGHVDCYHNGSLVLAGTVSEVEASLQAISEYAQEKLRYEVCEITRT